MAKLFLIIVKCFLTFFYLVISELEVTELDNWQWDYIMGFVTKDKLDGESHRVYRA